MSEATVTETSEQKPDAKSLNDRALNEQGRAKQKTAKVACPGCRHDKGTLLGKLKDKDVLQCGSCHSAYVVGAENGAISLSEPPGDIRGLSTVTDLQSALAKVCSSMKPGESLTVMGEPLRLNEPLAGMRLEGKASMLSIGGIAIAAEAAGFEPVNPDARPIVLTKPRKKQV